MKRTIWIPILLAAAAGQARELEIYWTDVEGGGSTLIVSPSGQALLVDTGFGGNEDRDAKRIAETMRSAGIKKIDIAEITHFHGDHVGGAAALAKLVPIERFYDHGDSIEANTDKGASLYDGYKALSAGKRATVKPGDKIPIQGLDITVVSANGEVLSKPLRGAGAPNDLCKNAQTKPADNTENSRSVGFLLRYGKFTFLDLGDLTWDREMMLACPANKIGTVTLFQATHHGFSNGASGAPAFVWAVKPQVVVVNNGARKGFSAAAYETIAKVPGLEDIWQLHRAVASDAAHNAADRLTANLDEGTADPGKGIKVSVAKDGKFTVVNLRNNFSKTYSSR